MKPVFCCVVLCLAVSTDLWRSFADFTAYAWRPPSAFAEAPADRRSLGGGWSGGSGPLKAASAGHDAGSGQAQTPSPETLLQRIDENQVAGAKITVWEMTIRGRRGSRTVKAKSWIQGVDRAFTEYLDPPRDAGTKMLKLRDQLWTYAPSSDRTIQIAGHMLRQSVMGSDMSYEDLMEDPKLQNLYEAKVTGEESVLERPCWVLQLAAKSGLNPAYHSRKLWVDKERFLVLKEERFATSGRLLKTSEVTKVSQMQQRWVAEHALFKDALKNDGGTEFVVRSIEFNPRIPDSLFSQASLRK
jgi:outer membrane lipoprotein-sorting protein